MLSQILDSAAMAFTRAFYLSLLSGHSVKKSFDIGECVLDVLYASNLHE